MLWVWATSFSFHSFCSIYLCLCMECICSLMLSSLSQPCASMSFSTRGTVMRCTCLRPTWHMLWGSTTARRTRLFPSRQYRLCFFFYLYVFASASKARFFVPTCRSANIHTYNETPRISFYMAVSRPSSSEYIPKSDLEAAIRWDSISLSLTILKSSWWQRWSFSVELVRIRYFC